MNAKYLLSGLLSLAFISSLSTGCGGSSSSPASTDATPTPAPSSTPIATAAPSASPPPATSAKWTYMVYIAGDNNLDQAALKDINEMEQVGSSADVNVVVMAELRPQNYPQGEAPVTFSGKVIKDNDPSTITSPINSVGSNLDMGDPATLRGFISDTVANYPAQKYALVLWSHGAGWKKTDSPGGILRGALQDETAGSFMSLAGITQAITDSGVALELIDFDACLMAMYEVAESLQGLTKVLVASEETEPGDGNPYTTLLGDLIANPDMDGKGLGEVTVQRFTQSYSGGRESTTKSALDMSKFAAFDVNLRDLAAYLTNNITDLRPLLQSARNGSVGYSYPENRDVGDLMDQLLGSSDANLVAKAQAVKTALTALVVAEDSNPGEKPDTTRSQGLAIFLPNRNEVSQDDLSKYASLPSSQLGNSWNELVNVLISGDTGQDLQQVTEGNFAVCITWSNPDADLDLYVYEPRPLELYAPWVGATSPNGFFTGDSAATGVAEECYAAAEQVEVGQYDFFINYFDGPGAIAVEIFLLDASTGFEFALIDSSQLDFSNTAPQGTNPIDDYVTLQSDPYSDWYYAGAYSAAAATHRSIAAGADREVHRDSERARRVFSKRLGLSKRYQ